MTEGFSKRSRTSCMRWDRVLVMILCALLLGEASGMCGQMIDGVVAVVDDTVIMYSDVIQKMKDLGAERFDRSGVRQTLQMMVEDAVVAKVYRRMGLPPVDDRQAQEVAREMGVDPASAKNYIMKSNIMDLMVKSRVVITEAMIRDYYDSRDDYKGVSSVHLKQILIEGDEAKAARVMEELSKGRSFDEVAREASDVLVNGSCDIGWVALDHLAPEVRRALDGAGEGEIRGPVAMDGRFLVFQLMERGVTGRRSLEEVRDEIVKTLEEKYRADAFRHWLDTTLEQYYIGIYL